MSHSRGPKFQFQAALQCYKFMDSDVDYDRKAIAVLLRCLQPNTCEVPHVC
jgi:hypothetical protein